MILSASRLKLIFWPIRVRGSRDSTPSTALNHTPGLTDLLRCDWPPALKISLVKVTAWHSLTSLTPSNNITRHAIVVSVVMPGVTRNSIQNKNILLNRYIYTNIALKIEPYQNTIMSSQSVPSPTAWSLLLRFQPQTVGGQRVGISFAQHDAISEQFEKDIVVAEENKAQRQSVVPALGAQQRV